MKTNSMELQWGDVSFMPRDKVDEYVSDKYANEYFQFLDHKNRKIWCIDNLNLSPRQVLCQSAIRRGW